MKQFKFLMVALTLLMGVSLTSCMGNSDPTVSGLDFGRVVESFPRLVIETPAGFKFTALNATESLNLYSNDYVYFQYSYDSDVYRNVKDIDATLTIVEKLVSGVAFPAVDKGENYESATIIKMGDGADGSMSNPNRVKFFYYDENKVILPLFFLLKEKSQESLNMHSFSLVYDENELKEDDSDLVLYLRHRSAETDSKIGVLSFRIFDIRQALNEFRAVTGRKPANIVICTNETTDTTTDNLDKKKNELSKYSVEYADLFKD